MRMEVRHQMKRYGYIRVSSKDQNPERQIIAIKEAGVNSSDIYMDYMSGKDFNRPNYRKLLRKIKNGDLLIIVSIDRLGRDYDEIMNQWKFITREKKADIEVLDMPLLNTKTEISGLTGVFITDMVLQILAYVAETERNFIRKRQAEGIAAAKSRGVHFGCKRIELDNDDLIVFEQWARGEINAEQASKMLKVSESTFYRRAREKKLSNSRLCDTTKNSIFRSTK